MLFFRVYIEEVDESELKLYVVNIQTEDSGRYQCRGRVDGNDRHVDAWLFIYGKQGAGEGGREWEEVRGSRG